MILSSNFSGFLIVLGTIIFSLMAFALLIREKVGINHWYHHFDVHLSSKEIYAKVSAAIMEYAMPHVRVNEDTYAAGGIFNERKHILRVTFKDYIIDICCASFGKGCYVSWYLGEKEPHFMSKIPLLNTIFGVNPKYKSYHQIDTALMFQAAIHEIMLAIVEAASVAKGGRRLTDIERQPMGKPM